MEVSLDVRRFRCVNAGCAAVAFAEQISGLTTPFARRTVPLSRALTAIGLALAGRAGSRLAANLGMPAGRDLLLSLIRKLPDPEIPMLTALGVRMILREFGAVADRGWADAPYRMPEWCPA